MVERAEMAVVLPRGEAIRNFVYSGALDELVPDIDLTIITVQPNVEIRETLKNRYQRVLPLEEVEEGWPVRFTREILDIAHGRWLWSAAARERWRLRDVEADTLLKRLKRLGRKAICYPFANSSGLAALSAFEEWISRATSLPSNYLQILQSRRYRLLFNGSHIHSRVATPLVHAAKALRIPTATFLFSWDNLTSQGRVMPAYDYYLVWNEDIKAQLLQIYPSVKPEQVYVTGTPQFDFHFRPEYEWTRAQFCERVGADPDRPIVLYSTGMANHMPSEQVVVERIADMLARMPGSPQLLVRVYPKDRTGRFDELKARRKDILFPEIPWEVEWHTPKEEDLYLLTNTIRHSAVGINVASTISLELCMFNKPVINVGYNPPGIDISPMDYGKFYFYDHYKPIVDSGAIVVAWSEQELEQALRNALTTPDAQARHRRQLISGMFGETLDGRSAHRVAQVLREIIQGAG